MGLDLIVFCLLIFDIIVCLVLFLQITISSKRYHILQAEMSKIQRLDDVPTVSLCIPARNETHALADCLSAALASDYPKLEIIVLDDCSQDKTSQIIRSFAHDGVRFVQGDVPSDGWLGKNNAYSALATQAKGSYLVFMSVDTVISPNTVSQIVSYMQLKKLSMMSVLPQRYDSLRASVLFAPLRYFWQVVLPLSFNTPVASALWAITDDGLAEAGGFESHKNRIDIENVFAEQFQPQDRYRFLIANQLLKVKYEKRWRSQIDTSIRLWYPNLEKSFTKALVVLLTHFALFLIPGVALVYALFNFENTNGYIQLDWVLALCAYLLANYVYLQYVIKVKNVHGAYDVLVLVLSFFLLPFIALQEIVVIVSSFYQYIRGRVDWKGRNICYPVTKRF